MPCDEPVMSIDFHPTILALTKSDSPAISKMDGMSLVPLLKGESQFAREALFWHYPHYSNQGGFPGGAIRMGDWKMLERFEDGRVHLYNLRDDVGERTDVAEHHPDRITAMKGKLHEWYRSVDAKFLSAKKDGPVPWSP